MPTLPTVNGAETVSPTVTVGTLIWVEETSIFGGNGLHCMGAPKPSAHVGSPPAGKPPKITMRRFAESLMAERNLRGLGGAPRPTILVHDIDPTSDNSHESLSGLLRLSPPKTSMRSPSGS